MQNGSQKDRRTISNFLIFWSEERSLTVLLVLLLIHFFVLSPGTVLGRAFQMTAALCLSFALLAGILSLQQPVIRNFGLLLVTMTIVFRTAAVFGAASWLIVGDTLFTLLSLLALIFIVLRQVSQDGPVSGHRIRGSIALYLLIAILFAFLYGLAEELSPGAFAMSGGPAGSAARGEVFYYFSIVTLTTVGFGDITAVHPVVRSLVMLEALIGQLYPAILIASLVSLHLETRRGGK